MNALQANRYTEAWRVSGRRLTTGRSTCWSTDMPPARWLPAPSGWTVTRSSARTQGQPPASETFRGPS